MIPISLRFSASLCTLVAIRSLAPLPATAQEPPPAAANPATPAGVPAPIIEAPAPGGLTADRVARRAADSSHEVRAEREESAAAAHGVERAGAGFIPRVTTSARYTRLSSVEQTSLGNLVVARGEGAGPLPDDAQLAAVPLEFPVLLNHYSLQAQLQIPLTDYALRLPQLYRAAEHEARAAEMLAQASRRRAGTDARVVYYAWVRARLQREVAQRSLGTAQAHLADAQTAHATGTVSRADVLSVSAQVATAELQLARARTQAEIYEKQLRVLMHDPSSAPYEIGEDLRGVPEPSPYAATDERALVARAIEQRLEPQALEASAGALRQQAKALLANELPRLDAVGGVRYENPSSRLFPQRDEFRGSWDVGLQVSWTPTDIFGTEAQASSTRARARAVEAERAALLDGIELEVKQELLALRETELAMRTSERGRSAAEESYRVRRAMFQHGMATSVELSDAENDWSRAELEVIGARIDRRIAEARLEHAVGEDRL